MKNRNLILQGFEGPNIESSVVSVSEQGSLGSQTTSDSESLKVGVI